MSHVGIQISGFDYSLSFTFFLSILYDKYAKQSVGALIFICYELAEQSTNYAQLHKQSWIKNWKFNKIWLQIQHWREI